MMMNLHTCDICAVCGSIGKGEEGEFIICRCCQNAYHPYCLPGGWTLKHSYSARKYGFECPDCITCRVCRQKKNPEKLVICAECSYAVHVSTSTDRTLDCYKKVTYDDQHQVRPGQEWRCRSCLQCWNCGKTPEDFTHIAGIMSVWKCDYKCCIECFSRIVCPVCGIKYGSLSKEVLVKCTHCKSWMHAECGRLHSADEVEEQMNRGGFYCQACKQFDPNPPLKAKTLEIDLPKNAIEQPGIELLSTPLPEKTATGLHEYDNFIRLTPAGQQFWNKKNKNFDSLKLEENNVSATMACEESPDVNIGGVVVKPKQRKAHRPGLGGFSARKTKGVTDDDLSSIYPPYLQEQFFGYDITKTVSETDSDGLIKISLPVAEKAPGEFIREVYPRPNYGRSEIRLSQRELEMVRLFHNEPKKQKAKEEMPTKATTTTATVPNTAPPPDSFNNIDDIFQVGGCGPGDDLEDLHLLEKYMDAEDSDPEFERLLDTFGSDGQAPGGTTHSGSKRPSQHSGVSSSDPLGGFSTVADNSLNDVQPFDPKFNRDLSSEQNIFDDMDTSSNFSTRQPSMEQQAPPPPQQQPPPQIMLQTPEQITQQQQHIPLVKQEAPDLHQKIYQPPPHITNHHGHPPPPPPHHFPPQPSLTSQQKASIKWESDEPLGESATIAPVLYCNLKHPTLKTQFPEWRIRERQIQKLWRKLSGDEKLPYLQNAKENRNQAKQRNKSESLHSSTGTDTRLSSTDSIKEEKPPTPQQPQKQQPPPITTSQSQRVNVQGLGPVMISPATLVQMPNGQMVYRTLPPQKAGQPQPPRMPVTTQTNGPKGGYFFPQQPRPQQQPQQMILKVQTSKVETPGGGPTQPPVPISPTPPTQFPASPPCNVRLPPSPAKSTLSTTSSKCSNDSKQTTNGPPSNGPPTARQHPPQQPHQHPPQLLSPRPMTMRPNGPIGSPRTPPPPGFPHGMIPRGMHDEWYAQQSMHLHRQVKILTDRLQSAQAIVTQRGEATEDQVNNIVFLQRQLDMARMQLQAHMHETMARQQQQKRLIHPPEQQLPPPQTPPQSTPVVRPALLSNGQTAPCVQIPSASQTVIVKGPDGKEQKLIIPPGMQLKTMANGQIMLAKATAVPSPGPMSPRPMQPRTIVQHGNPYVSRSPQGQIIAPPRQLLQVPQPPTTEQTIARIANEAKIFSQASVNAKEACQPPPPPPMWFHRTDYKLTDDEHGRLVDLGDPDYPDSIKEESLGSPAGISADRKRKLSSVSDHSPNIPKKVFRPGQYQHQQLHPSQHHSPVGMHHLTARPPLHMQQQQQAAASPQKSPIGPVVNLYFKHESIGIVRKNKL